MSLIAKKHILRFEDEQKDEEMIVHWGDEDKKQGGKQWIKHMNCLILIKS